MKLETKSLEVLAEALKYLGGRVFAELPSFDPEADLPRLRAVLRDVAEKMRDNFPYFHPYYAGQMLKPPHPVARLAYMLALWINPNNHAFDGGRASSFMEKEAVAEIAKLFGWKTFLGHLTSGGTMANLEALWIAGQLKPGRKILASEQAHYTHQRISAVLGLRFESVPCDAKARMDIDSLVQVLERGEVGAVVATAGDYRDRRRGPACRKFSICGTGMISASMSTPPTGDILSWRTISKPAPAGRTIALTHADSIVVDPHKHGLQPYGCGCVLYRDPEWAGSTSMTRRIPISPPPTFTWARSAWSARGPGLPRSLCGPRRKCCPIFPGANLPGAWAGAGRPL